MSAVTLLMHLFAKNILYMRLKIGCVPAGEFAILFVYRLKEITNPVLTTFLYSTGGK